MAHSTPGSSICAYAENWSAYPRREYAGLTSGGLSLGHSGNLETSYAFAQISVIPSLKLVWNTVVSYTRIVVVEGGVPE